MAAAAAAAVVVVAAAVACHTAVAFVDNSLVVEFHNSDDNQLQLDHYYQL